METKSAAAIKEDTIVMAYWIVASYTYGDVEGQVVPSIYVFEIDKISFLDRM